ncbi:hypothetical protein [Pseudochrobactrum sp. HB0163]|uniref:hypothetical protein n=1 Tax=Pseudochrobactrum sp. HB0163 TaxID=3450708 RepID=UPI003F6DF43E
MHENRFAKNNKKRKTTGMNAKSQSSDIKQGYPRCNAKHCPEKVILCIINNFFRYQQEQNAFIPADMSLRQQFAIIHFQHNRTATAIRPSRTDWEKRRACATAFILYMPDTLSHSSDRQRK